MSAETAHVVPRDDAVEHDTTGSCVCGPEVRLVRTTDGGDGWIAVHHSLDGREHEEGTTDE